MADKQPDILAIFTECLALDSDEERSRYLDNACQEDLHVRGESRRASPSPFRCREFHGGQPTRGRPHHRPVLHL